MGEGLTVGQIIFLTVSVILVLNAGVYGMRIQYFLIQKRAEPLLSVFIGLAVWQRVLSGSCDGLDLESAEEFRSLRRSFLGSMAAAAVAVLVSPAFMKA